MVEVKQHREFFSENLTVEISTPVEHSTKKRFVGYSKNAKNNHLTSKNPIFQRFRPFSAQSHCFTSKTPPLKKTPFIFQKSVTLGVFLVKQSDLMGSA